MLLFRFNGPVVFFNAPFFKRSVLDAVDAAGPELKWFVLDMIPVNMIDVTGLNVAIDLIQTLRSRGVTFVAAGRLTEWREWAEHRALKMDHRSFPTMEAAMNAFETEASAAAGT